MRIKYDNNFATVNYYNKHNFLKAYEKEALNTASLVENICLRNTPSVAKPKTI